jgi:hypothetical protein
MILAFHPCFQHSLPGPAILASMERLFAQADGIIIYQLHLLKTQSNLAMVRLRGASKHGGQ